MIRLLRRTVRISLLIGVTVFLYGSTAKPNPSWAKVEEWQYQETVKSGELSRKMSLGMKEVEPPEDMAVTDDDIDPNMAIWKAAQWSREKKHLVPEEDKDEMYHLFTGPVLETQENVGLQEAFGNNPPIQPYQQAEPDMDDVYHRFPGPEEPEAEKEATDDRYIPDQHTRKEPLVELKQPSRMVHTQPEEDKDEVYHRDIPEQHFHQKPQVQAEPRSRMKYTKPEEDRDYLYHN